MPDTAWCPWCALRNLYDAHSRDLKIVAILLAGIGACHHAPRVLGHLAASQEVPLSSPVQAARDLSTSRETRQTAEGRSGALDPVGLDVRDAGLASEQRSEKPERTPSSPPLVPSEASAAPSDTASEQPGSDDALAPLTRGGPSTRPPAGGVRQASQSNPKR